MNEWMNEKLRVLALLETTNICEREKVKIENEGQIEGESGRGQWHQTIMTAKKTDPMKHRTKYPLYGIDVFSSLFF